MADLATQNKRLQDGINSLLEEMRTRKEWYSAGQATHTPPEEMGEKGKAFLDYVKRVGTGEVAKEGLERMGKDLTSGDAEKMLEYFGFGGIMAGPKALTANLKMLAEAQKLKKLGASRDKIWKETGWFQYANDFKAGDKGWRFEIPDIQPVKEGFYTKAGQDIPAGERIPLGKGIQHEEALRAYPTDIFSSTLQRGGFGDDATRGAFIPNRPPLRGGHIQTRVDDDTFTGMHEFQHMVQRAEPEFVGGGSPSSIQKVARNSVNDIANKLETAKTPQEKEFWRKQLFLASDIAENKGGIANRMYRQITGEAEARMVQKRAKMIQAWKGLGYTDEQIKMGLRNIPPWKRLDVPEEKMFAPRSVEEMSTALSKETTEDLPAIFREQADTHAARIAEKEGAKRSGALRPQDPTMVERGGRLVKADPEDLIEQLKNILGD